MPGSRWNTSDRTAAWRDATAVATPVALAVLAAALTGIAALGLLGTLTAAGVAIRTAGGFRRAWPALGLAPSRSIGPVVAAGALGAAALHFVLSTVVMPVAEDLFGVPDLSAFEALNGNALAFAAAFLVAWIAAAFGEEIVFRGALLPRLAKALGGEEAGWATAFGIVAVAFGLAHAYQGPAGMVGTAVAGILFGLLRRQRVDGLWPAVLAHGIYDTYGLTNVYLGNVA